MKKHHFNIFRHEKHFEKLPQPHSQTGAYPWLIYMDYKSIYWTCISETYPCTNTSSPHYSQLFRFCLRQPICTASKREHVLLISQMESNVSSTLWSQTLHQLLWCHRHAFSEPNLAGIPIGDLNASLLKMNVNSRSCTLSFNLLNYEVLKW